MGSKPKRLDLTARKKTRGKEVRDIIPSETPQERMERVIKTVQKKQRGK